jgi:hypothetical protein
MKEGLSEEVALFLTKTTKRLTDLTLRESPALKALGYFHIVR